MIPDGRRTGVHETDTERQAAGECGRPGGEELRGSAVGQWRPPSWKLPFACDDYDLGGLTA